IDAQSARSSRRQRRSRTLETGDKSMTMKKFVSLMFATTLVFSIACGKGKEASKEDEGEDDEQTTTTAAASTSTAAPAAAAPAAAVSADAATLTGLVKFEGAAPKMTNIQMSADPYCQSQLA